MPHNRRIIPLIHGIIPLFALFLVASASPAEAAMRFCNSTKMPIEAAIAYRSTSEDGTEGWVSEGWWQIEPGQCARVYAAPLEQRFYFYYATSLPSATQNKAPYVWSGDKYKFCTDNKAFKIDGDGDCDSRNYQTKGFQQIDIGANVRDYTLDFKDNGN